jgi:hypothetical protein
VRSNSREQKNDFREAEAIAEGVQGETLNAISRAHIPGPLFIYDIVVGRF